GTAANAWHLAPAFLETIVARYRGTRLWRQELDGAMIEERADARWTRALTVPCRAEKAPPCSRIVVAIGPPASAPKDSASCGPGAGSREVRLRSGGAFVRALARPARRAGVGGKRADVRAGRAARARTVTRGASASFSLWPSSSRSSSPWASSP